DESVDLVLHAFEHGNPGDIFVQKAPAATIEVLANAIIELLGKRNHPISIIGTRHGEKNHETLLSEEDMLKAEDMGNYFRISPDLRDLNYSKYFDEGDAEISNTESYTSKNTTQLNIEEVKTLLISLKYIQEVLNGSILEDPESV
ncbi:MAG: polysaccharide biosynthesis protein, partial [Gammaproteobacteria bacterium]|nr:polysaccharide biosynthesis protein [Gammaproteobacteria bacterium]